MRRPIAFLVACVLHTVACAPSPQDRSGEPTPTEPPLRRVVVGVASDMPGLGTYLGYRWSGFEIALYQWLGSHSDPPFTPVPTPIPISDRVNAILDGRVDLVIEAFSITDLRREDVHFAGPYLITKQGFMVRTGDHISSPDQLYGTSVCTLAGSTSRTQLNTSAYRGRVTLTEETGIEQCVDRLREGTVDAVSTDQLILYGLAQDDPTRFSVVPGMTFGSDQRYGIGLAKGDVALCAALTARIKEFVVDGHWDRFFAEHFGDPLRSADFKPDVDRLDRCD